MIYGLFDDSVELKSFLYESPVVVVIYGIHSIAHGIVNCQSIFHDAASISRRISRIILSFNVSRAFGQKWISTS